MRRIITSAAVAFAVLVGACDQDVATAPDHAVAEQSAAAGAAAPGHRGNAPNILMLDDCDTTDPAYDGPLGGCPETTHPSARSFRGDVPLAELFELLFSPLAPDGQIIGHPSWRNQPSYLTVRVGQSVRVTNRGGRVHTLTQVADFGGGFIPDLNGALLSTPECGDNFIPAAGVVFVDPGDTQRLEGLEPGLHKFQCCIHPWMRAAIRAE